MGQMDRVARQRASEAQRKKRLVERTTAADRKAKDAEKRAEIRRLVGAALDHQQALGTRSNVSVVSVPMWWLRGGYRGPMRKRGGWRLFDFVSGSAWGNETSSTLYLLSNGRFYSGNGAYGVDGLGNGQFDQVISALRRLARE